MPDWSQHTAYSDPGRHRALLQQLPTELDQVCAVARNVIGHYRGELPDLPPERRSEVDSRWLEVLLDVDQSRHPGPLTNPREPAERVAGCCRDHSLFVAAALRERGVPARTCVGFAGYLLPGYWLDHVVVEYAEGGHWRRADPEQVRGAQPFDVRDLPTGPSAPFRTAAEVWRGYRRGEIDADRCCVYPGSPLAGPDFVRAYVIFQIAHRYGDELLLWDDWSRPGDPAGDELLDRLADLLVRADAGEERAERELAGAYAQDDRLHPGDIVTQHSPFGEPSRRVALR